MKYLCLISAETLMEQMLPADVEQRFEEYRKFTEAIRKSGQPPDRLRSARAPRCREDGPGSA